jgi:phage terminase large subunit-like protein
MKDIGELHILEKSPEAAPHTSEIEIDSMEALMQFGEKKKEAVRTRAQETKKNTSAELNEVVEDYVTSTSMPESEISELRRRSGVDIRIQESFGKVDRAAALAEQEIGTAAFTAQ